KDGAAESIMLARYPEAGIDVKRDADAEEAIAVVQSLVSAARSIRAEHDLPRSTRIAVYYAADPDVAETLEAERARIERISGSALQATEWQKIDDAHEHFRHAAVFAARGMRGAVPDVIDPEKERARLSR